MLAGPPTNETDMSPTKELAAAIASSLKSPRSKSAGSITEILKSNISIRRSVILAKSFQFICVGWSGVGRTAFINRLVAFKYDTTKYIGEIDEVTPTFMFPLDDSTYPCLIRTPRVYATQSFAKTFSELSISSAIDGIILCYDVTDRDSFGDFVIWAESGALATTPTIIVGTHLDEAEGSREVPISRATAWAKRRGVDVFDVSSKTGANIMESFAHLLRKVIEKRGATKS